MFLTRSGLDSMHVARLMGMAPQTVSSYTDHAARLNEAHHGDGYAAGRAVELDLAKYAEQCQVQLPCSQGEWRTRLHDIRRMLRVSFTELEAMAPSLLKLSLGGLVFVRQELRPDTARAVLEVHAHWRPARPQALHELKCSYDEHDLPDRLEAAVAQRLCSADDVASCDRWLAADQISSPAEAATALRQTLR